jgi:hypothetical protein
MTERRNDRIALDRASVRSTDGAGHMTVESSIITAAVVSEYYGEEIPDSEKLGLEPKKLYRLYRAPAEIEKGAPSLDGKPLMVIHRAQSADDHDRDVVVGSVTTPDWQKPKLLARLSIWDSLGIDLIESGEQKSLSAGYAYVPVMTPGTTPDGDPFDGLMTNIEFNHVALVAEPRVEGAVVGDSAISKPSQGEVIMPKRIQSLKATIAVGALIPFLKPRLAKDAKIDLGKVFANVKPKMFGNMKDAIAADIMKITKGKLAADAKIGTDGMMEGLKDLLEMVDGDKMVEGEDDADLAGEAPEETMDAEGGGLKEFLKGKISEDDFAKACDMMKPGGAKDADETAEEKAAREAKEKETAAAAATDAEAEKAKETKAMDAKLADAIKAERKLGNDIAAAREHVRPHVGALQGAFDSVDGVYQAALTVMGVDKAEEITGVPALRAVLDAKVSAKSSAPKAVPAMDAAQAKSFADRFPGAAKIKVSAL